MQRGWKTQGVVFAAVSILCAPVARAGNDEGVPVGNEAAMTGGAVAATIDSGAAIHHNPAGLAFGQDDKLDGSASLFVLRRWKVPDLIQPMGESSLDGNTLDLTTVASSLTFTRRLRRDLHLGLGIFVPAQEDVRLRNVYDPDHRDANLLYDVASDYALYRLGIGIAGKVHPTLSLGASLFVTYSDATIAAQISGSRIDDAGAGFLYQFSESTSIAGVGLELDVGLQWRPLPVFQMGISLRSPSINVYTHYHATSAESFADANAMFVDSVPEDLVLDEFGFRMVVPFKARAAVSFHWPAGHVSLDADVTVPRRDQEIGVDRRARFNVRAGFAHQIDARFRVGAGIFTDRSDEQGVRSDAAAAIDFYGFSAALHIDSPKPLASGRRLLFGTTIGFRYAYGFGELDAVTVGPDAAGIDDIFGNGFTDVSVHEIGLHIGSSLAF